MRTTLLTCINTSVAPKPMFAFKCVEEINIRDFSSALNYAFVSNSKVRFSSVDYV
jgi:hypothetical protein